MWFGFSTKTLLDILNQRMTYPSIFLGRRVEDPTSVHPYRTEFMSGDPRVPSELLVSPLESKPILIRWNHDTAEADIASAVELLAGALIEG